MPSGIEVINTSGTVLVNDIDPSLALKSKSFITANSSGIASTTFASVEIPVIAFSCAVETVCSATHSGTSVTANFVSGSSASITVYLFDRPVPTALGHGLQVFDTAGKCTFDSNQKYGRVVSTISGESTYSGSGVYAAVVTNSRFIETITNVSYAMPGGGLSEFIQKWDRQISQTGARVNGTSVTADMRITNSFVNETPELAFALPPEPSDINGPSKVLVIDVTGY